MKEAEELRDKFKALSKKCNCLEYVCICFYVSDSEAKKCAIIAQELVIKKLKEHSVVSEKENLILKSLNEL